MATLDGKDVPQCVQCTQFKPDARERTVTKPAGEMKRVLCDDCATRVADVYEVKPLGRQPARATETKGDDGPKPAEAPARGLKKEE